MYTLSLIVLIICSIPFAFLALACVLFLIGKMIEDIWPKSKFECYILIWLLILVVSIMGVTYYGK